MASVHKAVACPYCGSKNNRFKYSFFDDLHLRWCQDIKIFRCTACGLVHSLISKHDVGTYSGDYYVFQEHRETADRAFAHHCIAWLSDKTMIRGKRLLDVGCGNGFFCEEAKNLEAVVEGVEPSEETAIAVEKRIGIPVYKGYLEGLQITDKQFDIITLWDVLEHSLAPGKMLDQASKLLDKGGLLAISVPNVASIFSFISGPFWKGYNPYHISHFSPETISAILFEAKFSIVSMETFDNSIFSPEGIYRLGARDYVKACFAKMPPLRKWLLKRRKNIMATTPFTGHNDYIESQKKRLVQSVPEKIIRLFKLGDQIRIVAKKL